MIKRDGIQLPENKISALIPRQVPAFVREKHPGFVAFLKKYFEFMEQQGQAAWAVKSLLDLQDIDLTQDEFIQRFQNELAPTLPNGMQVTKRLILKNILQFHRARGTEKSYEALFRFLFNERVEFYYPYVDIFKTSDNTWVVNKTLRVMARVGEPFLFQGKKIVGNASGAIANVESVLKYQIGQFPVYELFLNPKSIEGEFSLDEVIFTENGELEAKIYPCVTGFVINDSGGGYEAGQEIELTGGSGVGARLIIGSVGQNGEIKRVDIIDPGVNYASVPTATIPEAVQKSINLVPNPSEFDQSNWDIGNNEVIPNAIANPVTGALTADLILETAGVGTASWLYSEVPNVEKGEVKYKASLYIKPVDREYVYIYLGGSLGADLWIHLPTGEIIYDFGDVEDVLVETLNDGWYKLSFTTLSDSGSGLGTGTFEVGWSSSDSSIIHDREAGKGIYVWNAQLSPIKSATGHVTKGALVTYPGFYLNQNSFVSSSKYLQDSYFYQQFSYVLKSNLGTNIYKDVVMETLHPAGLIMFGSVFADSLTDLTTKIPEPSSGGGKFGILMHQYFNKDTEFEKVYKKIVVDVPQPGEPYNHQEYLESWFSYLLDVNKDINHDSLFRVSDWKDLEQNTDANKPVVSRRDDKENLVLWSEDFSQAIWTKFSSSISADVTTAPNGKLTADKLKESNGIADHSLLYGGFPLNTQSAGTDCIFELWAKPAERNQLRITIGWSGSSGPVLNSTASVTFTLTGDGSYSPASGSIGEYSIEAHENGWYKCSMKETIVNVGSVRPTIILGSSPYAGNGQSGLYIWGAHFRFSGSSSEYVRTKGAAIHRGINNNRALYFDATQDRLTSSSTPHTLTSDISKATIFTVVEPYLSSGNDPRSIISCEASPADGGWSLSLVNQSGVSKVVFHTDQGGVTDSFVETPYIINPYNVYVIGLIKEGSNIRIYVNGELSVEGTIDEPSVPTAPLKIGGQSSISFGGKIAHLAFTDEVLPDDIFGEYISLLLARYKNVGILSEANQRSLEKLMWDVNANKLGPIYDSLERYKYYPLPHDPDPNFAYLIPGLKVWSKASSGVVKDGDNTVLSLGNLALNSTVSFLSSESTASERPILTRADNKENRITNSDSFDVSTSTGWVKYNSTIDSNVLPDPVNGTYTVDKLQEETDTNDEHGVYSAAVTIDQGETVVTSVYLKAAERTWAYVVRAGAFPFGSDRTAFINLSDGSVGTTIGTAPTVTDVGDGWYKVTFTDTATGSGDLNLQIGTVETDGSFSHDGVAGSGIYIWGAQCQSSLADSDYVRTFDLPELRGHNGKELVYFDGVDDCLFSNEDISEFLKEDAFTIYLAVLVRSLQTDETDLEENEAILMDGNEKISLYLKSSGTAHFMNNDGSVDVVSQPVEGGTFYVMRLKHIDGEISFLQNETHPQTSDTSGNTTDLDEILYLGVNNTIGAYSKISLGEILIVDRDVNESNDRLIMDHLKKKWLSIEYIPDSHKMSAPNEDYWMQSDGEGGFTPGHANTQLKDLGHLSIRDLTDHPYKRTNIEITPHVVSREVIWDIDSIKVDINPDYRSLKKVDDEGNLLWIKDQRRNVVRFEPVLPDLGPTITENNAIANGHSTLDFGPNNAVHLLSLTPLSEIFEANSFFGCVVFSAAEISSRGMILCDSLDPINFGLYVENDQINFEIFDGVDSHVLSLEIEEDKLYSALFSLDSGVMTLDLNGFVITTSVTSIDSLSSNLLIGGRGEDYFDGNIARIVLG